MTTEPSILLVEDDPNLASLTQIALKRIGCQVVHAADGEEAIAILRQRTFDLVCLDLMLPRTFGLEVCEFLRAQPGGATTPVLITTSRSLPLDVAQAIEAGASDFLAKPFHFKQLEGRVLALLGPTKHVVGMAT
jgi:DNA-binding response OmpR family regulator